MNRPAIRTFAAFAAAIYLCVTACDTTTSVDPPSNDADPPEATALDFRPSVKSVTALPVTGKSGRKQFLLRLELDRRDRRFRLPSGINVLARRRGGSGSVIYDDGRGVDAEAGDGVYSGLVSEGCVPGARLAGKSAGDDLEFSCTIDFVGPGKECGDWGTCPERVHRSLLWGLIEYDVDILFCVCLDECEVTKK